MGRPSGEDECNELHDLFWGVCLEVAIKYCWEFGRVILDLSLRLRVNTLITNQ